MFCVIMNSTNFLYLLYLSLLILHFGVCREIACIPSERETLLKFKHHLKDTSNRLSSWNATFNSNCCTWAGVVCNNITKHVIELHLNTSPPNDDEYVFHHEDFPAYMRSQFGGEINPCLVDLKHLSYLDLSNNYFHGMSIPSFLGTMTSLTYLNLSDAGFIGKIPHQIGNLSNLMYLDLRYVADGTIPSQIGNLSNLLYLDLQSPYIVSDSIFGENVDWLSSLSKLEYLDLGGANLSKSFYWLNTLQALPSLMELHLSNCMLPHHYNQPSLLNFSSLHTLDLFRTFYFSNFSFVPKWVFGITKLISLQLSFNKIQGPIPDGIRNLTLLENLDFSFNSFSSSIPHWLYGLHHLKFLNLRLNNLQGNISDALGNLTSLVQLDLSNNHLEGTIPTSLGNLCNLRHIEFSSLKLKQKVNEILEMLVPCVSHGLAQLALSGSQLSGNLIDQFGVFKNIVKLDFSNNSIGGALPRSLGKLSSLRQLDLSINQFNGNPFESLGSLSNLSRLYIGDNLFQRLVKEDDFANLTNLNVFHASGNNFTLKVGANWLPSFQLISLEMGAWQLGPNFPSWIQSQNNLEYLDISNTEISDYIPTWFWEVFPWAFDFNLSHNHIHGELGKSLTNPLSFGTFDLSSNHLHGKLPDISDRVSWIDLSSNSFSETLTYFLCNTQFENSELEFLNLASNNLSGKISDCWMKHPQLIDVNLQSNHFVGNLPPSMGSLVLLQSLNIRNNSLSGMFPTILKTNNQLISLDLGENHLSGTIPTWVGERLLKMKILRLRSNNFSGHIPNEICDMMLLQDLDLAQNGLSGNIPTCFNHLNAMLLKNRSTDIFIYSDASSSIYRDDAISILMWLKGRGIEYKNILGLVTNIDLSDNNLSGEIPREITDLDGLIFLNLSQNQLSGQIPQSIGNMRSLESFDISRNQLSGEIPPSITNLSFLSKIDMSYNHLKGKIPVGTQMQSFEASNFVGNNLCGPPLPINCSSNNQIPDIDHIETKNDGHGVNWFFVSMALGFVVGFWAVVAPLFIYRSWRYTYYGFLDTVWYKLKSYL